jgi:DNA-binding NtrC family response regulator
MKLGAYDFVEKPFDPETVRVKVDNALDRQAIIRQNQYLRSKLQGDYSDIIGKSQKLMEVLHTIDKIASSDLNVLITGETGTGKGVVAKAIHDNSSRKYKLFIKADCVSYSEELLESELFGHKKGSFTGANQDRTGRFEDANGGTIFLDEIGDISPKAQLKLLRVLDDKTIERVGDSTPIKINVRIIAATNRNLENAIENGTFRLDLYHRVKSFRIQLPPLRERREDISDLIEYFVRKNIHNKKTIRFSDEAKKLLINFGWSGNIRELQNVIESVIVLAPSEVIRPDDLPLEIRSVKFPEQNDSGIIIKPGTALRKAEKMLILKTLDEVDGNKTQAARLLGISLNGLRNKLDSYMG